MHSCRLCERPGLCNRGPIWDSGGMKWFSIRHLLAVLAWVGLVVAPLATPAAAIAVPMEMAAANIEIALMDMPEGMPCCPDMPAKPGCAKDCPFMAVCAGIVYPIVTGAATFSAPLTLLAVIAPDDDANLSGLAQGPPARPPKA